MLRNNFGDNLFFAHTGVICTIFINQNFFYITLYNFPIAFLFKKKVDPTAHPSEPTFSVFKNLKFFLTCMFSYGKEGSILKGYQFRNVSVSQTSMFGLRKPVLGTIGGLQFLLGQNLDFNDKTNLSIDNIQNSKG